MRGEWFYTSVFMRDCAFMYACMPAHVCVSLYISLSNEFLPNCWPDSSQPGHRGGQGLHESAGEDTVPENVPRTLRPIQASPRTEGVEGGPHEHLQHRPHAHPVLHEGAPQDHRPLPQDRPGQ